MLAQEIRGLDAREAEHFRNLKQSQGLIAVPLKSQGLESPTGYVTAIGGKPLGDFVRDAKSDFHSPKLNIGRLIRGRGCEKHRQEWLR